MTALLRLGCGVGKKQGGIVDVNYRKFLIGLVAVAMLSIAVAACGGGGSSSSSDGEEATSAATTGSTAEGSSVAASVKAAEEFLAPVTGHPSPFPVTEPLDKVPTGAKISYLELGNPVAAIEGEALVGAGQTMGVQVKRVKAGAGAQGLSSAMDTIVAEKPDGVIIVAADPVQFSQQIKELQEAGVAIQAGSIVDGEQYGLEHIGFGPKDTTYAGELMAAWSFAHSDGKAKNYVYYNVPELAFSPIEGEGVTNKIEELCGECSVRSVDVKETEIGNTASQTIVSDLQAHPETEAAVMSTDLLAEGLPAAFKVAGIDIPTIGPGSTPVNLEQIKKGEQVAGLGVDLGIQMWTMLDQVVRDIIGQEQTGPEAAGELVKQVLEKKDLAGMDVAKGWTGYPDFPERFAKLWGVSK